LLSCSQSSKLLCAKARIESESAQTATLVILTNTTIASFLTSSVSALFPAPGNSGWAWPSRSTSPPTSTMVRTTLPPST
ncbi:hypothetical protein C8T65DRAFT_778209, partial [Cerioporus squamosus]